MLRATVPTTTEDSVSDPGSFWSMTMTMKTMLANPGRPKPAHEKLCVDMRLDANQTKKHRQHSHDRQAKDCVEHDLPADLLKTFPKDDRAEGKPC